MTRVFNFKASPADERDSKFKLRKPMELPLSADLVRPRLPAALDQGDLGSCVGHGTAQLVYAQMNHPDHPSPTKPYLPSRLAIYYLAREMENAVEQDDGCFIRDAMKVLAKTGAGRESFWKYDQRKWKDKPTPPYFKSAGKKLVTKYESVPQTLQDIKECLAKGWPVVFGMEIRDSFNSPDVSRTGVMPMPLQTEGSDGWHCMLMIGYDSERRTIRCRNSWGAWGDEGDVHVPEDYIANPKTAADMWTAWTN